MAIEIAEEDGRGDSQDNPTRPRTPQFTPHSRPHIVIQAVGRRVVSRPFGWGFEQIVLLQLLAPFIALVTARHEIPPPTNSLFTTPGRPYDQS